MKTPLKRGSPIDMKRYRKWATEFASYRHQVPEGRIRDWLNCFKDDKDIAARLLDCVDFISNEQTRAAFRTTLSGLSGWSRTKNRRRGEWRFVPYSSSAGKSGDQMVCVFRHANNMASSKFDELFIYRSELVRAKLGAEDTVVLIDDFVGSGKQVSDCWGDGFGELVAEVGTIYLVVAAACNNALKNICDETGMQVISHFQLTHADNFFHDKCKHFNAEEKEAMLNYCKNVDDKLPRGYGDCGLVVVFSHTIPNNTLPILGKSTEEWEPLFRRYD